MLSVPGIATPGQRRQIGDLRGAAYAAARADGLAQVPALMAADAAVEAAFASGELPAVARMSCGCLEGGPHGATTGCRYGLR